jgi:hypothetical protein
VSELTLKHKREEIAADRADTRQAVFRPQNDFGGESKNFAVDGGADYSRNIFVFGDESSRYDDIKTWFRSTLRYSLARSVDFASPHERACSKRSARASRVRRLRCFLKIAPSLASVARPRSRLAYCCSAARTRLARLRRRDDVSVSSSRSFEVASSMAIVFIRRIISAVLVYAQDCNLSRAHADKDDQMKASRESRAPKNSSGESS